MMRATCPARPRTYSQNGRTKTLALRPTSPVSTKGSAKCEMRNAHPRSGPGVPESVSLPGWCSNQKSDIIAFSTLDSAADGPTSPRWLVGTDSAEGGRGIRSQSAVPASSGGPKKKGGRGGGGREESRGENWLPRFTMIELPARSFVSRPPRPPEPLPPPTTTTYLPPACPTGQRQQQRRHGGAGGISHVCVFLFFLALAWLGRVASWSFFVSFFAFWRDARAQNRGCSSNGLGLTKCVPGRTK